MLKLILFVCLFGFSFCQFPEEEGVFVLDKNSLQTAINQIPNLLVEFYAPWCGHCKSILPEFEKAAQHLRVQGVPVSLAKINADGDQEIINQFNITGFPTFKLFIQKKNKILDYKEGRHADDFVNFINKKIVTTFYVVSSIDEAENIIKSNNLVFFGLFENFESEVSKNFDSVAFEEDKYVFIASSDPLVASHFLGNKNREGIVVFKKYDEPKLILTNDLSFSNQLSLVKNHRLPLVNEFKEETADQIFGSELKLHPVLFLSRSSGQFDNIMTKFEELALKLRGKVICIWVDIDEEDNSRVLEFFSLSPPECPSVRLIDLSTDDPLFYKPPTPNLNPNDLLTFVNKVLQGQGEPFYKSEEPEKDWETKEIKNLAGKTFENFIDNNKDKLILVNFYVPWCGHCQSLNETWLKIGAKFKFNKKIIIAQMDSSLNRIPSFQVDHFPAIYLFFQGKSIHFKGERSFDALESFVESEGKIMKTTGDETGNQGNIKTEL